MAPDLTNELLMSAIEFHDVKALQECLANGADPNYCRYKDKEEPSGLMQPTTPLRLVMFCISNSDLNEDDLRQYAEIARILLSHGADPKPAMEIAELRYGKHDSDYVPKNPFIEVWDIVANAEKGLKTCDLGVKRKT